MKPTRDHAKIRNWARRHDAAPAEIKPFVFDGEPSILYFLFGASKAGTDEIRPISWEDFFAKFDLLELAMAWDEDQPIFELFKVGKSSGTFPE